MVRLPTIHGVIRRRILVNWRVDPARLVTDGWSVGALAVDRARSSFLEDATRFPPGSAELDCALVMRDLAHEWHSAPSSPFERAS